MSQALYSIDRLTKSYRMGQVQVDALCGIDLNIEEGRTVVILGPSGSGKSTLLNVLGGLDTASSGQVRFRDLDLTHASASALTRFRRLHVGFVFQFYNLVPSLTARENVALAAELARDGELYRALKEQPRVTGVTLKRAMIAMFRGTSAHFVLMFSFVQVGFALVITGGCSTTRAACPSPSASVSWPRCGCRV